MNTNFLTKFNPFMNGALALDLVLKTEEAGVALANHHLSIFATAHLYNALRQLQVIDFQWPAIDRIIDIHIGPIFANSLPTTPDKMQSHFELRVGLKSACSNFNKKMPWKIHPIPAGKGLRQLLVQDRKHAIYELEEGVQMKLLAMQPDKDKKKTERKQLTPPQFFAQVAATLPSI
jgi:hypothetical protein